MNLISLTGYNTI